MVTIIISKKWTFFRLQLGRGVCPLKHAADDDARADMQANVKLEGEDGREDAAGYLVLFNMLKSASRWGPCMITIWARDNLSDVPGVCCLWSSNNTCQPHTLIFCHLKSSVGFQMRASSLSSKCENIPCDLHLKKSRKKGKKAVLWANANNSMLTITMLMCGRLAGRSFPLFAIFV